MAFDQFGNFTRIYVFAQDKSDGVTISSDHVDAEINNIVDGLERTLLRDGSVALTGNFDLGGHSLVGIGAGSPLEPSVRFGPGGFYSTSDAISLAIGGTDIAAFSPTGITIRNTLSATAVGGNAELESTGALTVKASDISLEADEFLFRTASADLVRVTSVGDVQMRAGQRLAAGFSMMGNVNADGIGELNLYDNGITRLANTASGIVLAHKGVNSLRITEGSAEAGVGFRVTGAGTWPVTGAGVEIEYTSNAGWISAMDRLAGSTMPLNFRASVVNMPASLTAGGNQVWHAGNFDPTSAPTQHVHQISEVTGLQEALDAKSAIGHTHGLDAVTGLQDALDGKAATSHTHAIANVTGLQTALDGKAASSHTHTIANVTGLQTALDAKAASSHTHTIANVTGLQTALDGKAASSHTHTIANITDLQTTLDGKAPTAHSHAMADVNGLVDALATKAAAAHAHEIADVNGLQTALNNKSPLTHSHAISAITGLQTALDAKAAASSLANYLPLSGGALTGALTIQGNTAYHSGNLTLTGLASNKLTVGTNEITVSTDLVPDQDNVRSLGRADKRWKDIFVSANTIYLGDSTQLSGTSIVVDGGTNPTALSQMPTVQASKIVAVPYSYNPGGGAISVRPSIEFQSGGKSYPISFNTATLEFSLDADGNYGQGSLVAKAINLSGNLGVTGGLTLSGQYLNTNAASTFRHDGNMTIGYDASKTLTVKSATTFQNSVAFQGAMAFGDGNDVVTIAGSNATLNSTGDMTLGGGLTIAGNLIVQGGTTTVTSNEVNIGDAIITLNSDIGTSATPSENGGIQIARGSQADATWLWDETNDFWTPSAGNIGNVGNLAASTVTATTFTGALSGNATTATRLATSRTISLTGAVTGSVSFNGSANVSIATTATSTAATTLTFADTRSVVPTPVDFTNRSVSVEFKSNSSVGSPPITATGSYSHIMNVVGWDANGGGGTPTQVSFGDGLAVRTATNWTTWGPWRRLWHSGDFAITDFVAKTGGTMTGALTLAAGLINNSDSIIHRDPDGTATAMTAWMSYQSSDGAERGFFGFGANNTTMSVRNNIGSLDLSATGNVLVSSGQINVGDTASYVRKGAAGQIILGASGTNNALVEVGSTTYPIWHSGNFTPSNYATADSPTLTGPITLSHDAPRIIFSETDTNKKWYFIADGNLLQIREDTTSSTNTRLGITPGAQRLQLDTTDLTWGGNKVWHAGNMGTGSTLDADKLDGFEATAFGRLAAANTWTTANVFNSTVRIAGMTTLGGTTGPSVYSEDTTALVFRVGPSTAYKYLKFTNDGDLITGGTSKFWTSGNDGAGSGLDADTLDGLQATAFSQTGHTHSSIETTDMGSASGIDLNTFTTNGIYVQRTNTVAANGVNFPIALAGMLEVLANSSFVYQRYTVYQTSEIWMRSWWNNTWYAWRKVLDSNNYSGTFNPANYMPLTGGTFTGAITVPSYFNVGPQDSNLQGGEIRLNPATNQTIGDVVLDSYQSSFRVWNRSDSTNILDYNMSTGILRIAGSNAWHAGNLTNVSQLSNDAKYLKPTDTTYYEGRSFPRRVGGFAINFNWSGLGGQPSWVWGGNDGQEMYVYNPSNFNVNYATTAGTAANSAQLGGNAPEQYVYGDNATKTISVAGSSMTTARASGFYNGDQVTDAPGGSTGYWHYLNLRHHNLTNNYQGQIAISHDGATMAYRSIDGGTAKAWNTVWTSGNFDPASKLNTNNPSATGGLTIANTSDGGTLLSLATDRAWYVRQRGTGSSAQLSIENTTGKQIWFSNTSASTASYANITMFPDSTAAWIRINGNDVWHAGNLTPGNYAPLAGATFTGTVSVPAPLNIRAAGGTEGGEINLAKGPSTALNGNLIIDQQGNGVRFFDSTTTSRMLNVDLVNGTATLNGKALFHEGHTPTKSEVGLGSVDNTSDANKPVSTATQTALNGKLDLTGGTVTGTTNFTNGNQMLFKNGTGNHPTLIHRYDGSNYYILLSAAGTSPDATWTSQRPLSINSSTGVLTSSNGQTFSGTLTANGATTFNNNVTFAGASTLATFSGTGLFAGIKLFNTKSGGRDYRILQKDDFSLQITDETATAARLTVQSDGQVLIPGATTVGDPGGNAIMQTLDGAIELIRSDGNAYIDFKATAAQDYQIRMQANGGANSLGLSSNLEVSGTIKSGGSTVWHAGNLTNVSQLSNNSGYITTDGRAYPRLNGGSAVNFNWSGQSGQPSWVWGGNDAANMYVYNPSNFNVNYATTSNSSNISDNSNNLNGLVGGNQGSYTRRSNDVAVNGNWSRQLVLAGSDATDNVWTAPLEIREVGTVTNTQNGSIYGPGLLFHWGNTVATAIKMHSDGSLRVQGQNDNGITYNNFIARDYYAWGGWFRPKNTTGVYWDDYGRGITVSDNGSTYGHTCVFGTGKGGWSGYSIFNWLSLMANGTGSGSQRGLHSQDNGGWLVYWDSGNNAFFPANITAYSDERLKKNKRPIDDVAARRAGMAKAAMIYERDGQTRLGFGAQTLEQTVPEVVFTQEDHVGTKSVNYMDTVAILAVDADERAKEIQELKDEIAMLKAMILEIKASR